MSWQPSAFDARFDSRSPDGALATSEAPRRRTSLLAVTAVILSLVALLGGWIPVAGLVMLIPGLLAILLAMAGLAGALITRRTRAGLPLVGVAGGLVACILPVASTAVFLIAAIPLAWSVAMDHAQVQLEHEMQRAGIVDEQAERIGETVGEALRDLGTVAGVRQGAETMHRVALLMEDYHRDLRRLEAGDPEARAALDARFDATLQRIAARIGAELDEADWAVLTGFLRSQAETNASFKCGPRGHRSNHGHVKIHATAGGTGASGARTATVVISGNGDCGPCGDTGR